MRVGAVVAIFLVVSITSIFGQGAPVMPDYSSWAELRNELIDVELNGKNNKIITKVRELDKGTDFHGLIIYNRNDDSLWLAIHYNSNLAIKKISLVLFEYINNGWVMIKEYNNPTDPGAMFDDVQSLLLSKYKLKILN